MNENYSEDSKLKSFLQKNQPQVPVAPRSQLNDLLAKLGLVTQPRSTFTWLSYGGAVAFVLAISVVVFAPKIERNSSDTVVSQAVTEGDYFDDELPALDVGSDYYQLVDASE